MNVPIIDSLDTGHPALLEIWKQRQHWGKGMPD
jgi:hypothetical protein